MLPPRFPALSFTKLTRAPPPHSHGTRGTKRRRQEGLEDGAAAGGAVGGGQGPGLGGASQEWDLPSETEQAARRAVVLKAARAMLREAEKVAGPERRKQKDVAATFGLDCDGLRI